MAPNLPKTYKAMVFTEVNKPLVEQEVTLQMPKAGQVLVKVLASGVCHSDTIVQAGHLGPLPRIPGHEAVGDVVAIGSDVTKWKVGDRVGGGWYGGSDGTCRSCNCGQFQMCENGATNGVTMDGGYAEYVILRTEAVVSIPKELDPAAAAPLLCAGVTVFNSMRKMRVEAGGLVAVQGLGGLGHLAVQYASKMGFRVVALSSSASKKDFASKLGAHDFIDGSKGDTVKKLQEMGGADLILCTAPNPKAISPLVDGLAPGGKLLLVALAGEIPINTTTLITKAASVQGWPSGHALDSEEAIQFAEVHGVNCMIEKFKLKDAQSALDRMTKGDVRFRGVLTMD